MHSALIEPENLTLGSAVILDASFVMPRSPLSPQESFVRTHIPGARFFDIEEVSDHETDLPHMLPSAEVFADAASKLGIANDTSIVIYGQSGIVMGPARVWWMFRVFGHQNVKVLNGGLPAWIKAGLKTESGPQKPTAAAHYSANINPDLVRNLTAVKAISETKSGLLLDARPAERFSGKAAEPRPGLRAGHIPGSLNIPCMQLVTPDEKLKSKQELTDLFKYIDLKNTPSITTTCGSGVTACVITLALHELGYPDIPVYDGSWSEWGREECGTAVVTG